MFGANLRCKNVSELNLILPRTARTCTKIASSNVREAVPDYIKCRISCLYSVDLIRLRSQSGRNSVQCFPLTQSEKETTTAAPETNESVRVKFQLEEECQFGDSFHLIGDDPILGSWNLSDALPFNWSEGNNWTLTLELPAEKSIQYKFLFRKSTGEILWQPGPDRTLRTWKTKNVITVSADWSDADIQKISEAQPVGNETEEVVDGTLVKLSFAERKPASTESSHMIVYRFDENTSADDQAVPVNTAGPLLSMNNSNSVKQNMSADSAKRPEISTDKIAQNTAAPLRYNHVQVDVNILSAEGGDEKNLVIYDEGAVLVPGLTVAVI